MLEPVRTCEPVDRVAGSSVHEFDSGTPAGGSLVDVFFNAAMITILSCCETSTSEAGLKDNFAKL